MAREHDYGHQAHAAAERHLNACHAAMYAEEDGEPDVENPAIAPFCGCQTCVVREALHAAWPIIQQAVRDEAG